MAPTHPRVTGPIVNGSRGWPFGGPALPLADLGYREDEFFIEGEATRYDLIAGAEYGRDGNWQAEPVETARYHTRIVVYRPSDEEQFNGNVVLTWNNVSVGFELLTVGTSEHMELIASGAALVAVTAQRLGIEGLPLAPQGLAAWDPERYGELTIPSDDFSYDIFSQAAAVVGPDRSTDSVDPMGGFDVRAVIAHGASQSAARLATYINALQPLSGVFDGFLLPLYFGNGSPLTVGDEVLNVGALTLADVEASLGVHLLRDVGVPVMVVNSEAEAPYIHRVRQPDTDLFRYWECAGTAHSSRPLNAERQPALERDGVAAPPPEPGINELNLVPVFAAAHRHVQRWVRDGIAPPVQAQIEFGGEPPAIARDELGLAMGGIRLPQISAPLGTHSGIPASDSDIWAFLRGSSIPFTLESARSLHTDHPTYLARFEKAAGDAVAVGVILQQDVHQMIELANAAWLALEASADI